MRVHDVADEFELMLEDTPEAQEKVDSLLLELIETFPISTAMRRAFSLGAAFGAYYAKKS
jgi:hypothetical protein